MASTTSASSARLESGVQGDTDLEVVSGMRASGRRCAECGCERAASHCSRCRVTSFCNPDCQTQAWPTHKKACKANPTAPFVLRTPTQFCARALAATPGWFVIPPHAKLPRTREALADLIMIGQPAGSRTSHNPVGVHTAEDRALMVQTDPPLALSAAAAAAEVAQHHASAWAQPRLVTASGYGAEDMAALLCFYDATGTDGNGGSHDQNASASQLLSSLTEGHGDVLVCMVSTASIDLANLDVTGATLLPLSPAQIANAVMRRAEASSCGGHSDRMHRLNMRRQELALTARATRLSGEASAANLDLH